MKFLIEGNRENLRSYPIAEQLYSIDKYQMLDWKGGFAFNEACPSRMLELVEASKHWLTMYAFLKLHALGYWPWKGLQEEYISYPQTIVDSFWHTQQKPLTKQVTIVEGVFIAVI